MAIAIGLLGIGGGAVLVSNSSLVLAALSVSAVFIGVLYLASGIGFLLGVGWSWTLGMVVSALALVRNLVEISTGAIAFGIPGVVVALVVLWYLARAPTRAYFGSPS